MRKRVLIPCVLCLLDLRLKKQKKGEEDGREEGIEQVLSSGF